MAASVAGNRSSDLRRASALALSLDHVWLLASGLTVVWIAFSMPVMVLDFWWHLKVGEVILATGAIPQTDLFSFTAGGQPFVYQNWLAELLYAVFHTLGGLPLVLLLNALTLAAAFGLIFYIAHDTTGDVRLAAVATIAAELVARNVTNARPQVFSALLLAVFYVVVDQYRRQANNRLWLLPPLAVLWANVHGAFVLGLALIGVVVVTELVRTTLATPRDGLSYRQLSWLTGIALLCGASAFLNPEGVGILNYVRAVQNDPVSQTLVTEWQAPSIRSPDAWGFFALLIGVPLLAALAPHRPNLARMAVFGFFACMALTSTRNVMWFALVTPPILTDILAAFRRSASSVARVPRRSVLNTVLALLLLGITVLLSPWVRPTLPGATDRYPVLHKETPVAAAEFIARERITGRIFHPQVFGDYLIWRLGPEVKVFVDGRVHLYSPALWEDYLRIVNAAEWQPLLDRYAVDYLLLNRLDEGQTHLIRAVQRSPRWELIYSDSLALMYRRVT